MRRGTPLDTALTRAFGALPDHDRRLTHELVAGVLRQADALDQLIAPHCRRGIDAVLPTTREILRLGAYQLHYLDRIPAHAAVASAVELTREAVGERATGFVNAVLRQVSRAPRGTESLRDVDLATRLAAEWSHPHWLVVRWLQRFGESDTTRLLKWNNTQASLVVQPARADMQTLQARFAAAGVAARPAFFGAGLVLDASRPELLPGYASGDFYVQDPAQALVVRFAGAEAGSLVFDAAAAPGGKTIGLGRNAERVVAADLSRSRVARLRDNLARAGSGREMIVLADALQPPIRPVDLVLLDAPCLGTGTFARHPDARLRVQPQALARLATQQDKLLDAAATVVRIGGVLCYATCSLEPEEDEERVNQFLSRHPEFVRAESPDAPAELLTPVGDLQVLPHRDGMDGAYAARMVRQR